MVTWETKSNSKNVIVGQSFLLRQISTAFTTLLENEEYMIDDNIQANIQQAKLCEDLCEYLDQLEKQYEEDDNKQDRDERSYNHPRQSWTNTARQLEEQQPKQLSVRVLLSEVASSSTMRQSIVELLSSLISTRVENEMLLPATMDERANHDVLTDSVKAMTLTRSSMAAAELYCRLLALPGGSGLVQMDSIAAIANMIRRWNVELCGRESQIRMNARKQQPQVSSKAVPSKANNRDDDTCNNDEEIQPPKRSRLRSSRRLPSHPNSDDEEFSELTQTGLVVTESDNSDQLSPFDLLSRGMNISYYLIQIPIQKEFTSWCLEAQEIMLKMTCLILATSNAIIASNSKITANRSNCTEDSTKTAVVAEKSARTLALCIFDPFDIPKDNLSIVQEDESSESTMQTKRHDTTKFLLRGLLPFISWDEVVPAGEAGKIAAGNAACKVLECVLQAIKNEIHIFPLLWKTPQIHPICLSSESSDVSPILHSNQTPKSNRRSPRNSGRQSTGSFLSPKLKGTSQTTPGTCSIQRVSVSSEMYKAHQRPVLSLILGFLQKIMAITAGRERAANRAFAVNCIRSCLPHLPDPECKQFLNFVVQFCQSKLSVHRLVGSELIGAIFSEEWLWRYHTSDIPRMSSASQRFSRISAKSRRSTDTVDSLNESTPSDETSIVNFLFGALQGRLSDRYPTIRAASAGALAAILRRLAIAVFSTAPNSSTETSSRDVSLSTIGITHSICSQSISLVDLLRRRILYDEKATVQRACIVALVELLVIGETIDDSPVAISETDVTILSEICHNSAVLTRRSAAIGLTRLVEVTVQLDRVETLNVLELAWGATTLVMILDSESSCSNKAVELMERIVLDPILSEDIDVDQRKQSCAWRILASIVGGVHTNKGNARTRSEALRVGLGKVVTAKGSTNYVARIFKLVYQVANETLDRSLHEDLFSAEVDARRKGVWCLFEATMGYTSNEAEIKAAVRRSKIDLDFLTVSWDSMLQLFRSSETPREERTSLQTTMQKCLHVLSKLADLVDETLAHNTAGKLQLLISEFTLPPELIASAITANVAAIISYSIVRGDDKMRNCTEFIIEMYAKCENEIDSHSNNLIAEIAVSKISKALFTIGELSMVGFCADEDDKQNSRPRTTQDSTDSVSVRGLSVLPNEKIVNIIQALMVDTLPGANNESTANPSAIRAHAFVAFGKVCLRNERLAHESLNILARELHNAKDPAVQSNALLILGDLCVRYTNLVDRFLPVMAVCLQSGVTDLTTNALGSIPSIGSSLVRKHAILILSNLILQDFIKWRGLLFHRFLVACADEDDDVANLAETVLVGPLITKNPKLLANQFVESFFVLNRCTAHPIYVAAASMGDGGSGITVGFEGINYLSGDVGRSRRMKIYHLMLSKMTSEEKIGVTARIAKEVLDNAIQGSGDLHRVCKTSSTYDSGSSDSVRYESAFNVLSDALSILASPSIRVAKRNQVDNDDDNDIVEETPNEPANNVKKVQLAKGRLLSNVSRKHMIDTLLPILCNMKSLLQKNRSCLLKDLMACLVEFYNLYKEEVKESLANDPTLLQEIAFDARQYKKMKKQQGTNNNNYYTVQPSQQPEQELALVPVVEMLESN